MGINFLKYLNRKGKKILYGVFLFISDFIILTASTVLAYYIRFYTNLFIKLESFPSYIIGTEYIYYSGIFILSNLIFNYFYKLYDYDKNYRGSGYFNRIFKSVTFSIIIIILLGYFIETFSFSRIWVVLLFAICLFLLFLSRNFIYIITLKTLQRLNFKTNTIIVGIGENSRRIEKTLSNYKYELYNILGYIDKKDRLEKLKDKNIFIQYYKDYKENSCNKSSSSINPANFNNNSKYKFKVIGYLEDIREIVKETRTQKIIISGTEFHYQEILNILDELKGLDILVLMFPGFFELSVNRISIREIQGIPFYQITNIGFSGFNLFLKNLIDYTLSIILSIFFIPLFIIIAILIKIDSKGPVIYKQLRLTKDFKKFYIYKFRTMYIDAEKRLEELRKYSQTDGPIFKMKNDPRITRVGKFLRKFSIDEFPQILNVLKGDISLIGPRPPIPEEVEKYQDWHKKRLLVKQGITGLWQVSGRSDLGFNLGR